VKIYKMVIIEPVIFKKFPSVMAGISTKIGNNTNNYGFNLSFSVGDDEEEVKRNREKFSKYFGYSFTQVAFQKQIHSNIVKRVTSPGFQGESDAMITNKPNLPLVVSIADCTPILLYSPKQNVIAVVHSGWKGTHQEIIKRVIEILKIDFATLPNDLYGYIGPSISPKNYEVGKEFEKYFDKKYLRKKNDEKYLLNVKEKIVDDLIESGVDIDKFQISELCTYDISYLHSYRRDKAISGRMLGFIVIKN